MPDELREEEVGADAANESPRGPQMDRPPAGFPRGVGTDTDIDTNKSQPGRRTAPSVGLFRSPPPRLQVQVQALAQVFGRLSMVPPARACAHALTSSSWDGRPRSACLLSNARQAWDGTPRGQRHEGGRVGTI